MFEVRNHHDRIACADAEQRHKSNQRTQGEPSAAKENSQNAARQSKGQVCKNKHQITYVVKRHREQEEYGDSGNDGGDQYFLLGLGLCFRSPCKDRVDAGGKPNIFGNPLFGLRNE